MTPAKFPKTVRLLKSVEFERVFAGRTSAADDMIVVYVSQGISEQPRLGLTVSRKCGNAVARNRWKRSLREAFRLVQEDLPRSIDLVVLPRRGAEPDVERLKTSLVKLTTRLANKLSTGGRKKGSSS